MKRSGPLVYCFIDLHTYTSYRDAFQDSGRYRWIRHETRIFFGFHTTSMQLGTREVDACIKYCAKKPLEDGEGFANSFGHPNKFLQLAPIMSRGNTTQADYDFFLADAARFWKAL